MLKICINMIYRDIDIIGQWNHILSLLVFFVPCLVFFVPFSLHVKSFIGMTEWENHYYIRIYWTSSSDVFMCLQMN